VRDGDAAGLDVLEGGGRGPTGPGPTLSRRVVAGLALALLAGGAILGAAVAKATDHPARRPGAPTRVDAFVVLPAGGDVTWSPAAGGVVSEVELAMVDEGAAPLGQAAVSWRAVEEREVGMPTEVQALGTLAADTPTAASLRLFRPCAASAASAPPPVLLVTWTSAGKDRQALVSPYGLDRLWDALEAQCPATGGGVNPLSVTVARADPLGADGARLHLRLADLGGVALRVSRIGVSGGFVAVTRTPGPVTVGAHTALGVTVDVRLSDCRSAIERAYDAALTYTVSSPGAGSVTPTLASAGLSRALGALTYRACGR